VRVVVSINGAHVPPVVGILLSVARNLVVTKVVHLRVSGVDESRNNVATHVVPRVGAVGVVVEGLDQGLAAEDVVTHRGERLVRSVRQTRRISRFFEELGDLMVLVSINNSEGRSVFARHSDTGDGASQPGVDVILQHGVDIHPINVVGAKDHNVVGTLVIDEVEGLVDGVSTSLVPPRPKTLLGRDRGHIGAQHGRHPPGDGDVTVK